MNKIGQRVIKTMISVAICLIIYLLLMMLDKLFNLDRNVDMFAPTNWYTPFFATIATVYALQNNPEGSITQAKIRSFGSIIGGTFGAILIHIYEASYSLIFNISDINTVQDNIPFKVVEFIVTALGIILLIPITVGLKRKNAVFISCLTYLSVTISIRNGGMDVFFFAFNRIISTIIGVLISLYVNTFPHFKKRNKDILFLVSLDNSPLKNEITSYTTFKLNDLLDNGCNITFMTTSTLSTQNESFNSFKLKKPIIVLNGGAIFYPDTFKYKALSNINPMDRVAIENIFNKSKIEYFTYLINNSYLDCYYNSLKKEGSIHYFNERIENKYYSFTEAIAPSRLEVNTYVVVDKSNIIDNILKELKQASLYDTCSITVYDYKLKGYKYLKINSLNSNKVNALKELREHFDYKELIVVGSGATDIDFMDISDYSICLNNSKEYIKSKASYILNSSSIDDMFKLINKIYNSKDYKKLLNNKK